MFAECLAGGWIADRISADLRGSSSALLACYNDDALYKWPRLLHCSFKLFYYDQHHQLRVKYRQLETVRL